MSLIDLPNQTTFVTGEGASVLKLRLELAEPFFSTNNKLNTIFNNFIIQQGAGSRNQENFLRLVINKDNNSHAFFVGFEDRNPVYGDPYFSNPTGYAIPNHSTQAGFSPSSTSFGDN